MGKDGFAGPKGDKGDKGDRGLTTTLDGNAFPTGFIEGPPGPPGPPGPAGKTADSKHFVSVSLLSETISFPTINQPVKTS
jgi:hypothetical protein